MAASKSAALVTALLLACAGSALKAAESPPPPPGAAILAWTPDQQLVGYKAMETINPGTVIHRGDNVRNLPAGDARIDPRWTWKGQAWTLDSYVAAMRTSGLLVLKDGKVVYERYALGRTAADRWTSFSVAKSVTSTLVGAAIKDGKIKSLEAPVTDYIPELKGSAYEGVTVRHLLTMTSGVKWNEDYSDPHSDVAQAGMSSLEPGVNPIVSYMRRLPRDTAPGAKFVYKTGETDLAGILVSNAVGKSLADYASEKIWKPFGMEQDGFWMVDMAGHERGGCCISMTLRDYARLGQFMLEGGAGALPDGWVKDATSQHVSFGPGEETGERGYGYFWWLHPHGYAAEGIFGQEVFVFPEEHVIIAVNSAWPKADEIDSWLAQAAMAQAVRTALSRPTPR